MVTDRKKRLIIKGVRTKWLRERNKVRKERFLKEGSGNRQEKWFRTSPTANAGGLPPVP